MKASKRKYPRQPFRAEATIVDMAGLRVGTCVMRNVSLGGAGLKPSEFIEVPDKFFLLLARNGTVRRHCEVVWRLESEIGIRFIPHHAEI
jgi:PilZ domain-containing protein